VKLIGVAAIAVSAPQQRKSGASELMERHRAEDASSGGEKTMTKSPDPPEADIRGRAWVNAVAEVLAMLGDGYGSNDSLADELRKKQR
jgi:hypothetical protein